MEIQVIEQAGATLAVIIGDIDGKTASIVQERVLPLVSSGKNCLLDMGKVEYMSSAGLRLSVDALPALVCQQRQARAFWVIG